MENTLSPADKAFKKIQIKHVPMEVYMAILEATHEEQKRFGGNRRCGLRDGLARLVREYMELKNQSKLAV